eukprot:tig00021758_g23394.t1
MWGSGRRFSIAWTVSSDGSRLVPSSKQRECGRLWRRPSPATAGCAACVDAAQSFETLFRRALADGVKAVRVKYWWPGAHLLVGAAAAPTDAPWPLLPCGVRSHESIIVCHHFRSALWLWARAPFRMRELDGPGPSSSLPGAAALLSDAGMYTLATKSWRFPLKRSSNPISRPWTSYFVVRSFPCVIAPSGWSGWAALRNEDVNVNVQSRGQQGFVGSTSFRD